MSFKSAVRMVNVDFYMSAPLQEFDVMYAEFRGTSVPQVPVIRIFGSSETGQKICLHIHGVFPYLYIPYDGTEDADTLKYQIAASIDKAVNISFGQASSNAQHVYKITLVSGRPFYGYHVREHQFFKIFLFNPALVRKVSNLLQSEAILGRLYQPHESHIPYILQFMIDYNLHGMSRVLLSDLKFRDDSPDSVPKQSICELEADASCENILNRLEVSQVGTNPGIAALWEDERQRLRDKGEDSQIEACLTLENSQVEPTRSHLVFKRALLEKLCLSEEGPEKFDQNLSVYPAETPRDRNILSASSIDTHSSLSCDANSTDLNLTLDEDAKDLFEILQDLGRRNMRIEENEEIDSILSQGQKDDEEDNIIGDDLDLSVSMADTTPFKNIMGILDDREDDGLDKTLVPQVDGGNDGSDDDDCNRSKSTQKNKSVSKYSALPIFVSSPAVNNASQGSSLGSSSENLDHVKRQLSFHTSLVPDITICESRLECRYSLKDREKISDLTSSTIRRKINQSTVSSTNRSLPLNSGQTVNERIQELSNSESSNEQKIEQFSSGEKETAKIVETIDEKTVEFTSRSDEKSEEHPTVAQIYDFQTNYRAKEGCSTVFTQDSDHSSVKQSSQSSSDIFRSQTSLESFEIESNPTSDANPKSRLITPKRTPPSREEVLNTLEASGIPKVIHQTPFYSDPSDVTGSVEVGHTVLKIPSKTTTHLEDCRTRYDALNSYRKKKMAPNVKWTHENIKKLKLTYCSGASSIISPVKHPPTGREVEKWLKNRNEPKKLEGRSGQGGKEKIKIVLPNSPGKLDESDMELTLTLSGEETSNSITTNPVLDKKKVENSCQITGTSLNNTYGFKMTPENYQDARALNEYQHLTIFSLEIHVETRGDLRPDPEYDGVKAIFYSIVEDGPDHRNASGVIGVGLRPGEVVFDVISVQTEEELFSEFLKLHQKWDPDILCGYETELLSWGYLLDRSEIIGNSLVKLISRLKDRSNRSYSDEGLKIPGRILLDVWRLLRHEIALQSYTFESVAYHLLHKRIPLYSFKDLTLWWTNPVHRHRTLSYYSLRVDGVLRVMEQLDLIGRTSELARLFGIQFFEVLSRGSQFRVESMMLRLAKPLNYIPVSPSVQQRAKMKAPEYLPLILEPESKLYVDPVIVLDFQSLYPSMMIAYNYCFSTCLGKVVHLGKNGPYEFGATQLKVSRARIKKLLDKDCVNFSPCGAAFVRKEVRDGILPRMLREILETRLMVKKSMKKNKEDKILQKVLHNRQLGLKLIANVTYGYTAANFSGRMPAVELADSVVSKGRETLQRAIETVETTPAWKAKVVYGDTDSLFVLCPGKTKAEAFEIGKQIAEAVTNSNPDPVKLKLEKVYQPCILQTKKRYVGYMYEGPEQEQPIYEAKGIETVRRDGCPAVAKMLEKCLRLLFETKDVSLVKKYVVRQFHKIMTGRVSFQDLTFAREYRGAAGYRPGACVPALELARKWTAVDRRNEPRRKERVPYIIASGPPGVPLIRLVRSPREFLKDSSLRPNSIYYITKVIIPPINRCFNLIGADLNGWFNQMPRKQFQYLRNQSPAKKSTISQYFASNSCAVCGEQTQRSVCEKCRKEPQRTMVVLHEKLRLWEQAYCDVNSICQTCTGVLDKRVCISLDCPVLYRVNQTSRDLEQEGYVREVINSLGCEPESSF